MNQKTIYFELRIPKMKAPSNDAIPSSSSAYYGGFGSIFGTWELCYSSTLVEGQCGGPTHAQINQAVSDGLNKTLDKLMQIL